MRKRKREGGFALPLALMILMFFTVLVLAVLTLAGTEVMMSANLRDTVQARFCAEAGLEYALSELKANPLAAPWGPTPLDVGGTTICTYDVQKVDVSPTQIAVTSTATMASPQRGTAVQRSTFDLDVTAGTWSARPGSFRQN